MTQTIVAIDLETTGLDSQKDAIIEIGAVRFKGDRVEAEYSTLVNPGRPIPAPIVNLTGISDAMVAKAPRLSEVLPAVEDFVGEATVLGHNVKFDLGFLQAKKILRYNDVADTYNLAAALLPSAGRYNLGALAKEVGVLLPATHRALDDCRVTVAVYQALFQIALALPLEVLAEITNLSQEVEWAAGHFFEDAMRARSKELAGGRRGGRAGGPLFAPPDKDLRALAPAETLRPLDVDELAAILEPGGPFARHFPQYEYRSEQVTMLKAVSEAFSKGQHLLVEAGTGTGKSFGYLIPAVHWALQNGQRVVVSTNTINLQDQLINKDIPDLRAALGLDFRAALLKGRGNYLCPRRLDNMRRHRPKSAEEMRVLAKVLVWLSQPEADRQPISLGPIDRAGWARLSAEDENCTLDTCRDRMRGTCPFYQARKAAEAAHVLVVNHALLLADIATESRVLPAYGYLVLDEAHHLEAATTDGLSFELGQADFDRQMKELGTPSAGLLGEVLHLAREAVPLEWYAALEAEAIGAGERALTALALARAFFDSVAGFMLERRDGRPIGDYGQNVRITPATRTLAQWGEVEIQWDQLRPVLEALAGSLNRIQGALVKWAQDPDVEFDQAEDLAASVGSGVRYLTAVVENSAGLVSKPDPLKIYWAEATSRDGRLSLNAAPLHVGSLVEKHLWQSKQAVVMTSATLTTAGQFAYLKGRLNARDVDELAVGSPFDYETSTLVYLPTDMPEPQLKAEYQRALDKTLTDLCKATRGRTLVLFTSYAQLKQTANAIRGPLQRVGIDLYDQSDGTSRTMLLENFKTSAAGVLLGTKSFWEGVDVPGDALSVLVITRLPFDVPDDPIIAARSETFERPFDEYSVPEAVLKFRQGFGRLIRTKSDRGVVVLLDRRLLSKGYGRAFLDSLPRCTVRRAPLAQLAKDAAQWLGG
ncbi:MAG: DEAD/DEAH box helicase family protein [Anaerolineales bacterium]|nr:DEAD/DEAH box helicase family protein [Anaerolineales bacterium]